MALKGQVVNSIHAASGFYFFFTETYTNTFNRKTKQYAWNDLLNHDDQQKINKQQSHSLHSDDIRKPRAASLNNMWHTWCPVSEIKISLTSGWLFQLFLRAEIGLKDDIFTYHLILSVVHIGWDASKATMWWVSEPNTESSVSWYKSTQQQQNHPHIMANILHLNEFIKIYKVWEFMNWPFTLSNQRQTTIVPKVPPDNREDDQQHLYVAWDKEFLKKGICQLMLMTPLNPPSPVRLFPNRQKKSQWNWLL